jgi:hypothetical protein
VLIVVVVHRNDNGSHACGRAVFFSFFINSNIIVKEERKRERQKAGKRTGELMMMTVEGKLF